MKRVLLGLISSLFVLGLLASLAVVVGLHWYRSAGPLNDPVTIVITPGTGFNQIAQRLEDSGVIDSALLYRIITMAKGRHGEFKAGEYAFDAGMSPAAVSDMLTSGKSIAHAVTIPEGKTTKEIIQILLSDNRLSGMIEPPIAEGSLLPDTHYVHRGDARQSLIERMRQAREELVDTLWATRAGNLPIQSKQEAVILASIVEKETGVDGERAQVASVFTNRLRKGMLLQSDPTVIYAIEMENGPMQRPLTRKDWKFEHPYNTYVNKGLPPGPICHPGRAALEAVLNPPQTDYLYFVATGKGGHYFAKTYAEHNRNIARYKQELRRNQAVE